jgi:hypothetical protein
MTQTTVLNESSQVVLDSNGNGALTIGPTNPVHVWIPSMLGVQTSSNVKEPTFKFYRGRSAGPLSYINGTTTGSNDSTDVNGITLFPGETFYCVWTGGDAGAIASITIMGQLQYD